MTWFGIVNPSAGTHASTLDDVVSGAAAIGLDATFTASASPTDLSRKIRNAHASGSRKFVAVGGDGTAHLVVNAILSLKSNDRCVLGIVSVGSGSDFTRTFGHERGIETGLRTIANGDIYTVDIMEVSGSFGTRYVLNALNTGVAAASVSTADRLPRWLGPIRYRAAFWVALWPFRAGAIRVRIGRHEFSGDAINVVVANGQFFGGGLNIAPMSMLNDGEVDVQVFSGKKNQAFSIMPRLLIGSHLTHKAVRRYSGRDIHIDVPETWPVEADGEMLGFGPVRVSVIKGALDFAI